MFSSSIINSSKYINGFETKLSQLNIFLLEKFHYELKLFLSQYFDQENLPHMQILVRSFFEGNVDIKELFLLILALIKLLSINLYPKGSPDVPLTFSIVS